MTSVEVQLPDELLDAQMFLSGRLLVWVSSSSIARYDLEQRSWLEPISIEDVFALARFDSKSLTSVSLSGDRLVFEITAIREGAFTDHQIELRSSVDLWTGVIDETRAPLPRGFYTHDAFFVDDETILEMRTEGDQNPVRRWKVLDDRVVALAEWMRPETTINYNRRWSPETGAYSADGGKTWFDSQTGEPRDPPPEKPRPVRKRQPLWDGIDGSVFRHSPSKQFSTISSHGNNLRVWNDSGVVVGRMAFDDERAEIFFNPVWRSNEQIVWIGKVSRGRPISFETDVKLSTIVEHAISVPYAVSTVLDGRYLVFEQRGTVHRYDLETGDDTTVRLTKRTMGWSPDGTKVVGHDAHGFDVCDVRQMRVLSREASLFDVNDRGWCVVRDQIGCRDGLRLDPVFEFSAVAIRELEGTVIVCGTDGRLAVVSEEGVEPTMFLVDASLPTVGCFVMGVVEGDAVLIDPRLRRWVNVGSTDHARFISEDWVVRRDGATCVAVAIKTLEAHSF